MTDTDRPEPALPFPFFLSEPTEEGILAAVRWVLRRVPDEDQDRLKRKEEAEAGRKSARLASENFVRRFARNKKMESTFERLRQLSQHRAEPAGMAIRMLWLGRGHEASWELLLRVAAVTRAIESDSTSRQSIFEAFDFGTRRNRLLLVLSWALGRLAGADCWTLYGWDPRLSQPSFLGSSGLFYPEPVVGSSWKKGFVREALLDEPQSAVVALGDTKSPFRARERIRHTWVAHLIGPSLRAALFLNWRHPDQHTPPTRACRAAVEIVRRKGLESWLDDLTEPRQPEDLAPQELVPAVEYLSGWLTGAKIEVEAVPTASIRREAVSLARDLAPMLSKWLPTPSRREIASESATLDHCRAMLERLAREIFRTTNASCSVYRTEDGGKTLVFDGARFRGWDGRDLGDKVEVRLGRPCFVEDCGGLIGQSIQWASPILVREFVRDEEPSEGSLLRKRIDHVESPEAHSELAMPLYAGDTVIGGLGVLVSGSTAIRRGHLRWIEVLGLMTGNLLDLCRAGEDERSFVGNLLLEQSKDPPEMEQEFAEWVLEQSTADVVYLLLYDDALRSLRPSSIAIGNRAAQLLQKTARLRKPLSLEDPEIRRLIAHSFATKILPEPRKTSWRVFIGKQDRGYYPEPGGARRPFTGDPAIDRRSRGIALPFASRSNAAPDGVLWLGFMDREGDLLEDDTEKRIVAVMRVIASVHAAHRSELSASQDASPPADSRGDAPGRHGKQQDEETPAE